MDTGKAGERHELAGCSRPQGGTPDVTEQPAAGLRTDGVRRLADQFCREPELILACLQDGAAAPAHWVHEVYAAARLALSRCPDYADLNYYAGQAAVAAGDCVAAARLARRAVEINPAYTDASVLAAQLALRQGRRTEARACLEAVVARGVDYPDVHMLLGDLWRGEGDAARARACYQRALTLNGTLEPARAALAALAPSSGNGKSNELPA